MFKIRKVTSGYSLTEGESLKGYFKLNVDTDKWEFYLLGVISSNDNLGLYTYIINTCVNLDSGIEYGD